jgi:hypothetical protein
VPQRSFDTVFALNVNMFETGEPSTSCGGRYAATAGWYSATPAPTPASSPGGRASSARNLDAGGLHRVTVDWADPHHLYLTATRP